MSKTPYPESVGKGYPLGRIPERRKIKSCSKPYAWYKNHVGEIVTVHFFATFGCWDTKGRWIDYYDLGIPIKCWWRKLLWIIAHPFLYIKSKL